MAKKKVIGLYVCLAACILFLGAFVFVFSRLDTKLHHTGLFSTIQTQVDGQSVDVWFDEGAEEWVLFLPAHAAGESVALTTNLPERYRLMIDGTELTEETRVATGSYRMEVQNRKGNVREESVLRVVCSENIPTIYIETESGSMKAVHADKENRENAVITVLKHDGSLDGYYTCEIRGRGNTTWTDHEKKPYNLYMKSASSLLGMNPADKWVLLANALDESHLRAFVAMGLAEAAQLKYASQTHHADVYLNGEYAGLYLVTQAVATPENAALVERDSKFKAGQADAFTTKNGDIFQIHTYADMSSREIAERVQQCEDAVFSGRVDGLDVESLVVKYLVDEISKDPDAANFSAYYYLQDGVFYGGPVWDYDRAFSCRHRLLAKWHGRAKSPEGLSYCFNTWFMALYENEEFYGQILKTYQETFRPLLVELCNGAMKEYADSIRGAALMNQRRWAAAPWEEEVVYLEQWLSQRVEFLDETWLFSAGEDENALSTAGGEESAVNGDSNVSAVRKVLYAILQLSKTEMLTAALFVLLGGIFVGMLFLDARRNPRGKRKDGDGK